jgi:hypothetical protein
VEQIVRGLVAQNTLLASRLAALEHLAVSGGFGGLNPVADPAPDGGGWGGGGWGGVWGGGFGGGISPIGDPSPEELTKLSRVQLESRLSDIAHVRKRLDLLEKVLNEAVKRG